MELRPTRCAAGRTIQLKDVSYLRWTDAADTMIVTFGEVADGARVGWTKRQYWCREQTDLRSVAPEFLRGCVSTGSDSDRIIARATY